MSTVPKAGKRAKTVDADNENAPSAPVAEEMDVKDATFLLQSLRAAVGGKIVVNIEQAAANTGLKNPKSVSNRLREISKKYGIPISTTTKSQVDGDAAPKAPKAPKTPKTAKPKKRDAAEVSGEEGLAVKPAAKRGRPSKKPKVEVIEEEEAGFGGEEEEEA